MATNLFANNSFLIPKPPTVSLEVDFLPVGDGEKSGDAIAIRYGNFAGPRSEQAVVVIDGGNLASGDALVSHIKTFFGTDTVDLAILSHPDNDHASGLRPVMQQLKVQYLAMHKPWDHAPHIRSLFNDGRVTVNGLKNRLQDGLEAAVEVMELASEQGTVVFEPFQGERFAHAGASFHFLGPHQEYYRTLLPSFRSTPGGTSSSIGSILKSLQESALAWVDENFTVETLTDAGDTSAENNSSTVLLIEVAGERLLFTGDAGYPALKAAIEYANASGISLKNLNLFQVPHHGSRRNIGPSILNAIGADTAIISASKMCKKHPSTRVTNALVRRNMKPYVTRGTGIRHHRNAPERNGWVAAVPVPFVPRFQE